MNDENHETYKQYETPNGLVTMTRVEFELVVDYFRSLAEQRDRLKRLEREASPANPQKEAT